MLLELTQWLAKDYRAFSVFNYITLRAVLATLTALFIGVFILVAVGVDLLRQRRRQSL